MRRVPPGPDSEQVSDPQTLSKDGVERRDFEVVFDGCGEEQAIPYIPYREACRAGDDRRSWWKENDLVVAQGAFQPDLQWRLGSPGTTAMRLGDFQKCRLAEGEPIVSGFEQSSSFRPERGLQSRPTNEDWCIEQDHFQSPDMVMNRCGASSRGRSSQGWTVTMGRPRLVRTMRPPLMWRSSISARHRALNSPTPIFMDRI